MPAAVNPLNWAPSLQQEPNPGVNQVGGPVNGMAWMWKQDLNKPLTFPLSNQAGQSSWSASTNAMADPPGNQAYASQSSSRASQSSAHSSGMRNDNGLVYEQVFQYPKGSDPSQGYSDFSSAGSGSGQATGSQESSRSYDSTQEMPSFHYQTNAAAYPSGIDPSFGPTGYYQKFMQVPRKAVSWRVSDRVVPPAPPPSYITQSRNGYQRMMYNRTHTKYSPDPYAPMPMSHDVKDPPPQQADPGVAKEPQRYCTLSFSLECLLNNWSVQKWSNRLYWSPRTKW